MFRDPTPRGHSMYNFFVGRQRWISERDYARRVAGSAVMMLAGQRYGLECLQRGADLNKRPCPGGVAPDVGVALARLEKHFAFVGLTDHWARSICLFHIRFGGPCLLHEFDNTHRTHYAHTSNDILKNKRPLGGLVDKADQTLYAHASARFWRDADKYKATAERCARDVCPEARHLFREPEP